VTWRIQIGSWILSRYCRFRGALALELARWLPVIWRLIDSETLKDSQLNRSKCSQRIQSESEGGNGSQGTVRKGAAKSSCRARECLAQCLLDGTSLLSSRVRFSKRETKHDGSGLLVDLTSIKEESLDSSTTVGRSLRGSLTSQLSSVTLTPAQIES